MQPIEFTEFDPRRIALEESIFHSANGYLGLRASPEEGVPEGVPSIRGAYINAFYDVKPIRYGEKLYGFPETQQGIVNLTDVQQISLLIEGECFAPCEAGEVLSYRRSLDMEKGIATRSLRWRSPGGREVELTVRRMASLVVPELFILQYAVKALNFDGRVSIVSREEGEVSNFADPRDPRVAAESLKHLHVQAVRLLEQGGLIESRTAASGFQLAVAVGYRPPEGFSLQLEHEEAAIQATAEGRLFRGQTAHFVKHCIFMESRRQKQPAQAALRLLEEVRQRPLSHYEGLQQEALKGFWQSARVEVTGDPELQRSLDYSLYSLYCSAGRDRFSSVAAKGLSGEGYEGHFFWDTEIYIFPFFLLTKPELARSLLSFRHSILPAAREHARIMGHQQGALYAWRTIAGSECSGYFPSGSAQYHLSADIAHAVSQYWLATGDVDFMAEQGAEIVVETARLFIDAGHWQDGSFRLDAVTGPDEYSCIVNNNFYTNAAARSNLLFAAQIVRELMREGRAWQLIRATGVRDEELDAFERAGERMYLPYDEERGIHAQDDAFLRHPVLDLRSIPREKFPLLLHFHPLFLYRHQVCKQADTVLAHYLYEDLADIDTMRRSYLYYEPLTTHDSSLSSCVFAIMAAKLGDMDKALVYFRKSATLDLDDAHQNTKDGIHTANMGGSYLAIVGGFAGLRIKRDGLSLHPRLPPGWEGYAFPLNFRGRLLRVTVGPETLRIDLIMGKPIHIKVYEKALLLTQGLEMDLQD